MEKTHEAVTGKGSALSKYRQVMIGTDSLRSLIYYELCQLLTFIPGGLGMALRKMFWPRLFASCGRGVLFGFGVVLRQPKKMVIGASVVISEYCVLDARHGGQDPSILIGDNVILSNNVMLSCKEGAIAIGNHVGINAQTIIQSTHGNRVIVGADCVIGQRCFIIAGGNYDIAERNRLIRTCPIEADGGVHLADNVWLGGNVTVLGGVSVGEGSVAAAGSVLSRTIPSYSICMGIPARVVRERT